MRWYLIALALCVVAILYPGQAHAQAGYVSNCKIVTTPPTYSAGTYQPETCDTHGNIYTNGSNVTQTDGGLVSSSPPSLIPGTISPLSLSVGGGLRVTCPDGTCTTLGLSQGAPTVSQLGTLDFGAVTTSAPTYTTGTVNSLSLTTSGALRVDASGSTEGVNVNQFGGNNVVTGTGASGLGIPRVTISNDSSLAANQSVNLSQVAGGTTATGHGTAAGSLRVELPTDGTGVVGLVAGSALVGKVGIDQTTPGVTNGTTVAPTSAAAAGITSVVSASAEATHVLKASAGNLYSVYATNLTATSGYLLVLNATSAPADGAVTPIECVPLPANGNTSISFGDGPMEVYSTGITAVITSATTCYTKTTGTVTGFIHGAVQ